MNSPTNKTTEEMYPPSLVELLISYDMLEFKYEITRIEIEQPDTNTLIVEAWWGEVPLKKIYSKATRNFYCEANSLRIPKSLCPRIEAEVWGIHWGSYVLYQDVNGDLVVLDNRSGIGAWGIIPYAGSYGNFYRFHRIVNK